MKINHWGREKCPMTLQTIVLKEVNGIHLIIPTIRLVCFYLGQYKFYDIALDRLDGIKKRHRKTKLAESETSPLAPDSMYNEDGSIIFANIRKSETRGKHVTWADVEEFLKHSDGKSGDVNRIVAEANARSALQKVNFYEL